MPYVRSPLLAALTAAGALFSLTAHAGDGVTVQDAWARASAGAASNGAAYVSLVGGVQPDTLISASTPVAETAEVHATINDNGVMKMRAEPNVPIEAGQTVTFAPGGNHIMLMGLKQPLIAGQTFPLTLTFAHTPPLTVDVQVRGLTSAAHDTNGDQMHMH